MKIPEELEAQLPWIKDLIVTFLAAAVFYFVILSSLLGTSSPLTTVTSCSMKGVYNIGDMLVLQGVRIEDIDAPLVNNADSFSVIYGNDGATALSFDNGELVNLSTRGDVIVYNSPNLGKPIIHRVVAKINNSGKYLLITKGDANPTIDQECSTGFDCISPPVKDEWIVGRAIFRIPLIGHIKLLLTLGYEQGLWC